MFYKKILIFFFTLFYASASAQDCQVIISGKIFSSEHTESVIAANICHQDHSSCTISDQNGAFQIKSTCFKKVSLVVSFIGFKTKTIEFYATKDTVLNIILEPQVANVDEVVILKDRVKYFENEIESEQILAEANKNIGDVLKALEGVNVLKTGSGNSKPIVQGLYGNRIGILNNGVLQSGQSWGNDHSPEIDPYTANKITIVNSVNALEYSSAALGGLLKIDQKNISYSEKLHGKANYVFETNGLGHSLNAEIEKHNRILPFRVGATLKMIGDRSAPSYYLTNTGKKEGSFNILLDKKITEKISSSLYYSFFYNEIGILNGSHISNLTDLEEAIGREIPFKTSEKFSYNINAPQQKVSHHLLKSENKFILSDKDYIHLKYSFQFNNRREFDVRRSQLKDKPALSLQQSTHDLGLNYTRLFNEKVSLKNGVQFNFTDNTNQPETGVLPLIPDYNAYKVAAFSILDVKFKSLDWSFGARYDFKNYNVAAISKTLPRRIENHRLFFHTYGLSSAVFKDWNRVFKLGFELSYLNRAPEVNELFSFGLHQGVSGIEQGNEDLKVEKALKSTLYSTLQIKNKLKVSNQTYFQTIANYTYLQAEQEFQLTIRGAFPLYSYRQTQAIIAGTDFKIEYNPIEKFDIILKYSLVRGFNTSKKIPLVYLPADNLELSTAYHFKTFKKIKDATIGLNANYVFKQKHVLESQDFLTAPKAYFLLGLSYSNKIALKHSSFIVGLDIDNLLNTKYRDYLNRQRYYADELGINAKIRISYIF